MTENKTETTPTGFQIAFDALMAVTSLRRPRLSEDIIEFIEEASAPLFDQMLAAPCSSLSEVVKKGEAIMAEYGGGVIAPEMLAVLVDDARSLMK